MRSSVKSLDLKSKIKKERDNEGRGKECEKSFQVKKKKIRKKATQRQI